MIPRILPFPFPLNVGTDICQISRIHRILSGGRARRFVRRVLAPQEVFHPSVFQREALAWLVREEPKASRHASLEDQGKGTEATKLGPDLRKAAEFLAGRYES